MKLTGEEFRSLALSLEGTVEVAHFDRRAFKFRRIFASLAPDGLSANILIAPEEREYYGALSPGVFSALRNKWGERGWTHLALGAADSENVFPALQGAWMAAGGRKA